MGSNRNRHDLFNGKQADPNETKNIASDNPEIVSALRKQLDAGWKKAL